jgi:son of sevenless
MVAIISGLNNPPIRRLKRTWEQVNTKFMSLLGACEMTIDTGKNFANYRTTLAKVAPPCVPFIGKRSSYMRLGDALNLITSKGCF